MGIPRDFSALAAEHQELLKRLRSGVAEMERCREQAQDGAGAMAEAILDKLLSQIPVEELNREKKGIRITPLKNGGYHTFKDLYRGNQAILAAIDGISDQGAADILAMAEKTAEALKKDVKIRISADDRTEASMALITGLYRFRITEPLSKACGEILKAHEADTYMALQALEPAKKGFRFLFAPREQKQQAESAYQYLRQSMDSGWCLEAKRLLLSLEDSHQLAGTPAFHAFQKDPIPFFNSLERFCPGILGNQDGLYGLPQDLARQVQAQPLALQGLKCQLRRYQEWGVKYILKQGNVLLGDEMGLGKTVQAIAAMVSLKNGGGTHFLVICPASVIENWVREIRKHSDLTALKIHGDSREETLNQWIKEGGVAVTNFETAKIFHLEDNFRITLAVVDEAHYIKNPEAQRTCHVKAICSHAQRRLFMTGTAMENRVEEMVSLLFLLEPQIAAKANKMAAISAAPQFREAVAPVYYRRKRDEVLTELPDLIEKEEWCEMGPAEESSYEEAVLNGHFAKARRVSWDVENPLDSSKIQRLLEIVEDAGEDGRKVIVFSFFLHTIEKVCAVLGEKCLPVINGSVPVSRRQEIIDAFNQAPAGSVLPAQIQAGGTGLNIQCASVVILCEPQLKPSIENQAVSRAYRMGQTRNVLVYRLLCEDSVDEEITKLLIEKQAEFDTYADESAAARESLELDQKTCSTILKEEAKRIQKKRENTTNVPIESAGVPKEKESV